MHPNAGVESIVVKDAGRRRVAASHGLSHYERDLLAESFDYMLRRGPGLFVGLEAGKGAERRERRQGADAAGPKRYRSAPAANEDAAGAHDYGFRGSGSR